MEIMRANHTLNRRDFLKNATGAAILASTQLQGQSRRETFDLIVAGGTVMDPYNGINKTADVGIKNGKIVQVADSLPRESAGRVLDAKGLYVTPGWIDLHTHVFVGTASNAIDPDRDAGVYTGVTTLAEPGGFRGTEVDAFRNDIVDKSITRVIGFVNVAAHRNKEGEPMQGSWKLFDQEITIQAIEDNRDILKGVKVLASIIHAGNLGTTPTKLAVQAARETGTHVMAHIGKAPPIVQDTLSFLGKGDIVTHSMRGFPGGLFHRDGRPVKEAWEALERGVRFDLGHGAASFSWEAARNAKKHHFPIHSLSTDIHSGSVHGPVWSYGRNMAKYLHLGYTLTELVQMTTLGPAELIDEPKELGSLSPGTVADLTLFRIADQALTLTDSVGLSETADHDIQPVHCIRAGKAISDMKIPPAT
ncbi:amidohydrolase/deacetylase family metallohydrolase [Opitutales bacterium]|nr:amidohydrolase/deacetylase family metallohydrolase [Opitutales bacterium]